MYMKEKCGNCCHCGEWDGYGSHSPTHGMMYCWNHQFEVEFDGEICDEYWFDEEKEEYK